MYGCGQRYYNDTRMDRYAGSWQYMYENGNVGLKIGRPMSV